MFCEKCVASIAPNEQFCTRCGSPVPAAQQPVRKQPVNQQPVNQQYQRPQYQQPQYQQQSRQNLYQQAPQKNAYPAPAPQQQSNVNLEEHVSVGGWVGRMFLMMIPIVNIVLLFVWAFGDTKQYSLKTWAKAELIMVAIGIGIGILFVILLVAFGFNFLNFLKSSGRYY